MVCLWFSHAALTAPAFGTATTSAAAPATGFSFGSTNTGKKLHINLFVVVLSLCAVSCNDFSPQGLICFTIHLYLLLSPFCCLLPLAEGFGGLGAGSTTAGGFSFGGCGLNANPAGVSFNVGCFGTATTTGTVFSFGNSLASTGRWHL